MVDSEIRVDDAQRGDVRPQYLRLQKAAFISASGQIAKFERLPHAAATPAPASTPCVAYYWALTSGMMLSADDFREELQTRLTWAVLHDASYVEINAGELHRAVGEYPGPDHKMPTCCNVMHQEMREGDEIVAISEKGAGASLTIRYKLPRTALVIPIRFPNAKRS